MSRILWVALVGFVFLSRPAKAHEGHDIPGAMPPPPHGGKLQEATHGKHELFYEVIYREKKLRIYALTLKAGADAFETISPKKALSQVSLKVEIPREKKTTPLKPELNDESIQAPFDAKNSYRILVHLSSKFKGETKTAKIQLELH